MNMRDIKFWFAPLGVAIGISMFITVSVLIARALEISSLQKTFPSFLMAYLQSLVSSSL
ncbi:MAG: hypothetical protein NTX88_02265 [Candidatus Atribacteria bacterium]|nr:hypothetical protein [Candidatus Atribacteria bacterium]